MVELDLTTLIGMGCVALSVVLIAFSRYRYWLVFMLAGMVFWGSLELVRYAIQSVIDMPLLYGYICAFMMSLIGFTIALVIRDKRDARLAKSKVMYMEHTPVYEEDQRPYVG